MQQSTTDIPGTTLQESTASYERSMTRQARRLRFNLRQRSSRIRHPMTIDMEPDGSSFYFCFAAFYLWIHCSRVDDNLGERACRLQFKLQQRSSRIQKPASMDTKHKDPSFCFRCMTFYLWLHCSRVDDSFEDRMHRQTAQQLQRPQKPAREKLEATPQTYTQDLSQISMQSQNSELRQNTQHARSVETTLSGLQGPSLSFSFEPFYLQLRRFREYHFLQGIIWKLQSQRANATMTRTTVTTMVGAQMMEAVLGTDRRLCEAGTAVQRE
ncbi:hypothetical protein F5J12DRAFT_212842 [Pisolithus orientalis]|uniref:uncharacterized protein n=1 Tax=Pisolithus orientalis TaxID=936130 RepID=UPI00222408F4|nr:uncharacterized protein F5J12DRAFT_212842 [Pisolithus orientalis]KAI6002359.1 hypothetical protein F5J12DRAFT_212842 [Pisolithus orientalis]